MDSTTEPGVRTRRSLLAALAGGVGAWVATSVSRVSPALAEGEAIVVGGEYGTATSRTQIWNVANDDDVFAAGGNGTGTGVIGHSLNGVGVLGESTTGIGVSGESGSGTAVNGQSVSGKGVTAFSFTGTGIVGKRGDSGGFGGYGVEGINAKGDGVHGVGNGGGTGVVGDGKFGVLGRTSDDGGIALWAQHFGTGVAVFGHSVTGTGRGVVGSATSGQGVRGEATSGAALYGTASTGYALRTSGRVRAEKVSGVATIAAGKTTITVTPGVDVTSSSFVLLTPKANIGSRALWFTTDATNNRFTVRMSSSRSSSTPVAWLLLG